MKRIIILIFTLALIFASTQDASAVSLLLNGGFEDGFNHWTTIGAASIQTSSFGSGPIAGTKQGLIITGGASVGVSSLESFLGLSSGVLTAISSGSPTHGTAIKQTVTAPAGNYKLSTNWNFLTNEGTPSSFNDFAFWSIVPAPPAVDEAGLIADTYDSFVASSTGFSEETGYNYVYREVHLANPGTYTIGVGVLDLNDSSVDSALLFDEVSIELEDDERNTVIPEPSTMLLFGTALLGVFIRRRKI